MVRLPNLARIRRFRQASELLRIFRIMQVRPLYLIISVFSSLAIAFFDGLSMGLLVPLAKGVIEANFDFLKDAPVFKYIIAQFPQLIDTAPAKFLFLMLVATIFLAAVFKNMITYLVAVYTSRHESLYLFNLRRAIFRRYLSFGKLYFDRTSQGYLNEILEFCKHVVERMGNFLAMSPTIIFTIAAYFGIMAFISWKLTVVSLIIFPFLHYSMRYVIDKIEKTARFQTRTTLRLSREVFNVLSCIPLIKAYSKEREAEAKFYKLNDLQRRLIFSLAKKKRLIAPLQETIMLMALLLLISSAAFIFIKGKLGEISGFLVFFFLLRRTLPLLVFLNNTIASMAEMRAPIRSILKVFDDQDKHFVPEGTKVFDELRGAIRIEHLSFNYIKSIPILKDVSFTVEKGKLTAVVGPTGAGKTTVISLLMRFYNCPPRSILVDGTDIREFTSRSLLAHMAYVSQDILLFNDTIRYNVTFGIDRAVTESELINVTKKARLYEAVMRFSRGFDTEIGDRGVKLSGGERQRVSIARALLKKANILILDEATSSLDTHTERLIQEAVEEAIKGRTTIVIAHRLSTIKNADKIVVVEDGRFIEEGALDELLAKKGKFYEYWQEQKFY
jgi:subfamily B ATP-binding cassette protein MsbA